VYGRLTYPALGVVPVAMALSGLALGTVVGMLLRRTLLSVGVTGALLVLAEFGLRAVRPYLYPMVHQVQHHAFRAGFFVTPNGAWVVSSGALTLDGRKVLVSQCYREAACRAKPAFYGTYQPVSHGVPSQLVESGLLLVLAAGLVAFAFRQVRRSAV
jgi:hypothetical protein